MGASMTHPVYTATIIKPNGTTYKLKEVTTDLDLSYQKNQLAGKVTITVANIKVGSDRLNSLIALKDKIYVYANTGSGAKKIYQGIVWERKVNYDASSKELQLIGYDRLIYLQCSKSSYFFKKGKKTKDIITSIAKRWGFKISFKYKSISHPTLKFHNQTVADIIVSILDETKKKTGAKYSIYMEDNVIVIETVGQNSTIYKIQSKENAIQTVYRQTMDDMVTKVVIVKPEEVKKNSESSGKYLTVTSVKKNTDKYGTLQEILVKNKDDKLADVKKEANEILKEKATPKSEFEVKAIDNPLVKKGHKVYIAAGNLKNYYIVEGVDHDATNHVMYLEVIKA